MSREFEIPLIYRSKIISKIKQKRKQDDKYKKDFSPSIIDLGKVVFKISRHFGFCFGVENAIEIAYKALEENSEKKIYLLSEMIHNPIVNQDLINKGIKFLRKTDGTQLIPFSELNKNDLVIIPAFGTTLDIIEELKKIGIDIKSYNTTCPFVERVWNKSKQLGELGYTVILHGHDKHEETRATFSHSSILAPTIIIRNLSEATLLSKYITRSKPLNEFYKDFENRYSENFNIETDLKKIGVVNQTTMLAGDTQNISLYLKDVILNYYNDLNNVNGYFADTRDTLCYATSENQDATKELIKSGGDVAVVVGGYNSSNTSHLVELLEFDNIKTYYIKNATEIKNEFEITFFNLSKNKIEQAYNWLPKNSVNTFLITAGASCPDSEVDEVIRKIAKFYVGEEIIENRI